MVRHPVGSNPTDSVGDGHGDDAPGGRVLEGVVPRDISHEAWCCVGRAGLEDESGRARGGEGDGGSEGAEEKTPTADEVVLCRVIHADDVAASVPRVEAR